MLEKIIIAKNFKFVGMDDEIQKKVHKEKFFGYFRDERINLEEAITNKSDVLNVRKFNLFIERMNYEFDIDVSEMFIFLDEEGYKLEKLVKILSQENKTILESEIRKIHRNAPKEIKEETPKNKFFDFII